ncbi:smad nuclear-interacting protein 1 [Schistocerca nitens]|uniref:smad nuclear-interacting protein 1 n=1 Tax=Schistocerca nitens TaxID=7011 RepID=UPI00211752A7|nr:smad nuclear-interacting protein 1 [Schistocerca nitens]
MRIVHQDDSRNMKSEVRKSHHHSRHRHHERHSKHKRRQESSSKTATDDASPAPVPSDTSGSERCFPVAKDQCGASGSESPENVARKRRQRDGENTRCDVMTISISDTDNDAEGDEEKAKRRKKHRHKEKKKRKHCRKHRLDDDHTANHLSESRRKRDGETDNDHSPDHQHEQQQMLVRVKQEPLSSDEETRRRQRAKDLKQSADVNDRNWHSNSSHNNLRPDHRIKEEPRDRSSSGERKPHPELLRRVKPERRNGTSEDHRRHRDRRNGRVNGESSSSVKTERDDDSRSRSRTRRRRNDEQEERSRDHVGDSREGPRRIKRERPTEDEREYEWGKSDNKQAANNNSGGPSSAEDKKKPNFGLSGKLTEDVNVYNGVVIKYSEPPEARKPKRRWRFYPFKGDEALPTLYLHRQSAFLIGRDRKVADIPVDHPSCSKQHAALQYRLVPFTREDGTKGKRVRPYIIDLDSANGTYVNNKRIEARKYVELMERDVIKFGYSSRDYVLLHEHSKGDEEDDDQNG